MFVSVLHIAVFLQKVNKFVFYFLFRGRPLLVVCVAVWLVQVLRENYRNCRIDSAYTCSSISLATYATVILLHITNYYERDLKRPYIKYVAHAGQRATPIQLHKTAQQSA